MKISKSVHTDRYRFNGQIISSGNPNPTETCASDPLSSFTISSTHILKA